MAKIDRREDTNPKRGVKEYGDVKFADEVNKKYPIDSAEHVRAAWSYIHKEHNAEKYSDSEVKTIEGHIRKAAEKFGVTLSE